MTDVASSLVRSRPPTSRVEDLRRIAHGAPVALAPDAVERIRASRAIVDALVDGPALIYGLNTGLGHLRDVRVPRETLRQYQELIVAAHEGAIGDPLPTPVVRAAIAVRLNGIARGGAGRQPAGRRGAWPPCSTRRDAGRREDRLGRARRTSCTWPRSPRS